MAGTMVYLSNGLSKRCFFGRFRREGFLKKCGEAWLLAWGSIVL
jgi:hypothetical protein